MVTIQCGAAKFHNIEAIVFDKDGTLANSALFLQKLGRLRAQLIDQQVPGLAPALLQAFGIGDAWINPAGLTAVGSRREDEIVAAGYVVATGCAWIQALEIAQTAFDAADLALNPKARQTPLLPGGREAIDHLASHPLRLGIVSSDTPAHVVDFAQVYDLAPHFHLLMGEEPGLTKPNPEVLLTACDRLGVNVAQTLMIGDSAADMTMARAAGAAGCVGVTWGWPSPMILEADVLIDDFAQIQVWPA